MYCKSCGAYMEDSYNVCQACGTKRGLGASFCDKCGSVRQIGVAFCQNCGNSFNTQTDVDPSQSAYPRQNTQPYSQQTTAQQYQSVAQTDSSRYLPDKKFCRNCGAQVMNNQVICTKCGVKVGQGTSFCPHCAAPVQPGAVACMNCGMSIKTFDIADYFKSFYENFASIFRTRDIKSLIFDYGAIFISVIMFILSFIPSVYASMGIYGLSTSLFSVNLFGYSGFSGFLIVVALVAAIARFEPNVIKFIGQNQKLGKYYVFVVPGLMVVSLLITVIKMLIDNASVSSSISSYVSASAGFGFNFCGWLIIIFTLAAAVLSVLSYLRKENKISI